MSGAIELEALALINQILFFVTTLTKLDGFKYHKFNGIKIQVIPNAQSVGYSLQETARNIPPCTGFSYRPLVYMCENNPDLNHITAEESVKSNTSVVTPCSTVGHIYSKISKTSQSCFLW